MESEDRDSEEAEKPTVITFDPSLPTSHAVSVASMVASTTPSLDWSDGYSASFQRAGSLGAAH